MPCADKAKLIRNFSRHARLYDRYANVQRAAADALVAALPAGERTNIFEIGCGTGYFTRLLREKFRTARLTACDFSESMIEIARQKPANEDVAFLVADAETMVLDDRYDLIASNAALQWFEDLGGMLKKCRAALAEDGLLAFSIFGPETFRELDHCLRLALGSGREKEGGMVRAKAFLPKDRIADLLRASFPRVDVAERTIREEYPSLRDLLAKIKYTGARGDGIVVDSRVPAMLLDRVEQIFQSEFGCVAATYQIFLFTAEP